MAERDEVVDFVVCESMVGKYLCKPWQIPQWKNPNPKYAPTLNTRYFNLEEIGFKYFATIRTPVTFCSCKLRRTSQNLLDGNGIYLLRRMGYVWSSEFVFGDAFIREHV